MRSTRGAFFFIPQVATQNYLLEFLELIQDCNVWIVRSQYKEALYFQIYLCGVLQRKRLAVSPGFFHLVVSLYSSPLVKRYEVNKLHEHLVRTALVFRYASSFFEGGFLRLITLESPQTSIGFSTYVFINCVVLYHKTYHLLNDSKLN